MGKKSEEIKKEEKALSKKEQPKGNKWDWTDGKNIRRLAKAMEECEDGKRYFHTLGVAFTAASMAMRYDVPVMDAQIAGLLHDCAKCFSDEKLLAICSKNHLEVTEVEARNPYLLHGKVGAFIAKTDYQINDVSILNAICYHTTGHPDMTALEKIIFIADYIEPGRKQAPHLTEIRKLAFEDLDQAMVKILEDTLAYLGNGDGEIDPLTKTTYDYYKKLTVK